MSVPPAALVFLCVLNTLAAPLLATQTADLPAPLLDKAYTDIRTGFSLRPLYGSTLAIRLPNDPASPERLLPPLADWSVLQLPESKQLVRFLRTHDNLALTVHLLVTRTNLSLTELLTAREDFWTRLPAARKIDASLHLDASPPHALASFAWQQPDRTLQVTEGILQADKGRFFLLTLLPADPNAPAPLDLMSLLIENFSVLNSRELSLRQREARDRAAALLTDLDLRSLQPRLPADRWLRIQRDGKDVGFYYLHAQLAVENNQNALDLNVAAWLADADSGNDFARMQGWAKAASDELATEHLPTGPLTITGAVRCLPAQSLERFHWRHAFDNNAVPVFHEIGASAANRLRVHHFEGPQPDTFGPGIALEVNTRIYLPGALALLLEDLVPPNPTDEYLFLRYSNRSLRYHSLRIAGRETLQVRVKPSDNAADSHAPTTTDVITLYLVSQTGAEGPIVQSWLDPQNRILQQKADNGLALFASSREALQQHWPDQIEKTLRTLENTPLPPPEPQPTPPPPSPPTPNP